jgi:hypothetical protein
VIVATAVPATYLVVYSNYAELAGSSWFREQAVAEDMPTRSFLVFSPWPDVLSRGRDTVGQTAVSEETPPLVESPVTQDHLIEQLNEFRSLDQGWDGERAVRPRAEAIRDASRFVRVAGESAGILEPTLHTDGSVILDIGDDAGSIRFKGDDQVIYALRSGARGIVRFDGFTIPDEIKPALA